jgi:hypothetical protein
MASTASAWTLADQLGALHGVSIPVASAILAVLDQNRFTIIDTRALRTLQEHGELIGSHRQAWWEGHFSNYNALCCTLLARLNGGGGVPLTLRQLDRALWEAKGALV